jgi:ABC-type sugar transport system permease subunit
MTPSRGSSRSPRSRAEARLAWLFAAPAIGIVAVVGAFPVLWTLAESLHQHDLRMPWLGRPFIGLTNFSEMASDARFWSALVHTMAFTIGTVALELVLGLGFALTLNRARHGVGMLRTAMLLPWAIPTVVAALVWRFMFETNGLVNHVLTGAGLVAATPAWFADPRVAWIPIVLADVWKSTPFMTLLLLAGLQTIDQTLYEAAALDGAGAWRQILGITIPLLMPTMLAAVAFRSLDAFRVFDLIYVMTRGGPGTATETLSLYVFQVFFRTLRFGYGAALAMLVFVVSLGLAFSWLRLSRRVSEAG